MELSENQMYEIREGLENGVDVSIYTNTDFTEEQMMEIEAMEAIFMDDFNCISSKTVSFSIAHSTHSDQQGGRRIYNQDYS